MQPLKRKNLEDITEEPSCVARKHLFILKSSMNFASLSIYEPIPVMDF